MYLCSGTAHFSQPEVREAKKNVPAVTLYTPSSPADRASLEDVELTLGRVDVGRVREAVAGFEPSEPDGQVAELVP